MLKKFISQPWLPISTGIATAIALTSFTPIFHPTPAQSVSTATPKTFLEWCKSAAKFSPEAKYTIDILLAQAGTRNCTVASQKLSQRSSLNLTQFPGGTKLGTTWTLEPKQPDTKNGVGQTNIVDLRPIASLKNLQVLLLSANLIKDVSPLREMTNLRELDLYFNNISDIKPLASLKNLRKLALNSNQIQDVRPLSMLNNLIFLQLNGNRIKDVSTLSNLSKLQVLKLGWNQIEDVRKLSNLKQVKALDLRSNPVATKTCPIQPKSTCEF